MGSRPAVGSSRNKQLGIQGKCAGEPGALAHAAGELGGVFVGRFGRQADHGELHLYQVAPQRGI